jgi:adenylate cyclase
VGSFVVALMLLSRRQAGVWFVLYALNLAITVVFDDFFLAGVRPVSRGIGLLYFAMNMGIFSMIIFAFAMYFVHTAVSEREKANGLLLNILPRSVAQELKDRGATAPHSFRSASVLFTDFQGFTQLAETMTAEALIADLDECFRQMDAIVERHGLEKIKTIGDAYMCAGGVPEANRTHAIDCALAGLQMLACIADVRGKKQEMGQPYWEMRLGIHSGSLVAGVVGAKKFAYDLWGDTVNTASRMESGGHPGRLNVSASTYAEVRFLFDCEHRGKVSAKGKGEVDMYFVNRIKSRFSRDGSGLLPNENFWSIYRKIQNGAKLIPAPGP